LQTKALNQLQIEAHNQLQTLPWFNPITMLGTRVKRKSSIAHKSVIETINKVNAALVDSINCIHEVNIQIEDK
jgi:ppGpp synthetase/RelA/SpoT-type nucleotidyltranferase